jgi:hypothetical protein
METSGNGARIGTILTDSPGQELAFRLTRLAPELLHFAFNGAVIGLSMRSSLSPDSGMLTFPHLLIP